MRALIRTKYDIVANLADDILNIPPNTIKTHTSAWNNWLRWCSANAWPPLAPTPAAALRHMRAIAERSQKPGGTIKAFRTTLSFLADLDPIFDVTLTPAAPSKTWLPPTLFKRAVRGVIRRGTTRTTTKQPYLDMFRVIASLKQDADKLEAESANDMSPATYRSLRNLAIASFAAVVPSRPSELAGLQHGDVHLYVPETILGVRAVSMRLHELGTEYLRRLVASRSASFHIIIELRRSKTDAELAGIPKRLQHARGAVWSPARALLCAALASRRLAGEEHRPSRREPVFRDTYAGASPEPSFDHLSPGSISHVLERRALVATGTPGISGRGWRPAAASWLLSCGVDKSTVLALGGWKSDKSLSGFYVRHLPMSDARLAAVLDILPEAMSRARADNAPAPALPREARADDEPLDFSDDSADDDDDQWAAISPSPSPPSSPSPSPSPPSSPLQAASRMPSTPTPLQRTTRSMAAQRAAEQAERVESARRAAHLRRL